MKDLGKLNYLLGISIKMFENGCFLYQESYRNKVLERFKNYRYGKGIAPIAKILESNEKDETNHPFQNILGSLMYMSVSTRSDITFAIIVMTSILKEIKF